MFVQKKINQDGIMNPLAIPVILAILLLIGSVVTAVFFYTKYIDQRDNNQPKIEAAVAEAEEAQKSKLESDFVEREKLPNKNYTSPAELGSVKLVFPKTWSSYVELGGGSDLNYYGHPNFVPSKNVNYALRMSVTNRAFADEVKKYDSQVKKGTLKATAVQVSGTTGTRLDGLLKKDQEGSMVIFPLRDKTLKVWTESNEFKADFNNIVLANLTFVP